MRVLLVEDDAATAGMMELMLKSEGFNVYTTDLGEEGVDLAKLYDYDAVSLDLNLPDMNGFDVLRQIRAAGVTTPVLICSGTTDVRAKVKALDAGADDYMTKPFHKDELVARLRAIIRRSRGLAKSSVTIGALTVRLDQKTADVGGQHIPLTGKEWRVLEVLALRKDRPVTKDEFLNHLYGGMDEPELKIIDVFVCKLRKKLTAAGAGRVIQTVWGRGYSLTEDADPPAPTVRKAGRGELDIAHAILSCLAHGPAMSVAIAMSVGVHDQTILKRLRKMIAAGLVVRTKEGGPHTGPSVYGVTPKGLQMAPAAKAAA